MTPSRKAVRAIYWGLSALALLACWRENFAFMSAGGHSFASVWVAFWPALLANHATTSLTVDIFLYGVAGSLFMVFEARRLGIRWVFAYIVLAYVVAVSVTFPLFLAAREARLEATGDPGPR